MSLACAGEFTAQTKAVATKSGVRKNIFLGEGGEIMSCK